MPLSDAGIRNLKPKENPYKQGDFAGLYLLVRPGGSKLWRFKYRIDGREKLLAIGRYPDVSLAQARQIRDEARANMARGVDPGELKQEKKRARRIARERSFASISDMFLEKSRKEGRATATLAKTEWLLGIAQDSFGSLPIDEVSAPVILECLRKVESRGNLETARRLRSKIGAVFRYAIANGLADVDPTLALKGAIAAPQVTSRAALTDPLALGELLTGIDAYQGHATTRIALQILALVVQRPGELRQATWAEIDTDLGVWTIPAERMKMRRPHRVPLGAEACRLFDEIRELTGAGSFVFPAISNLSKPMSENTLNGAIKRIGFEGQMTAHGFRASFSTLANESSLWNPDAIERTLAHVDANTVRRAYARGEHWDERVKLAEWWAGQLVSFKRLAKHG
jgi:integrase